MNWHRVTYTTRDGSHKTVELRALDESAAAAYTMRSEIDCFEVEAVEPIEKTEDVKS